MRIIALSLLASVSAPTIAQERTQAPIEGLESMKFGQTVREVADASRGYFKAKDIANFWAEHSLGIAQLSSATGEKPATFMRLGEWNFRLYVTFDKANLASSFLLAHLQDGLSRRDCLAGIALTFDDLVSRVGKIDHGSRKEPLDFTMYTPEGYSILFKNSSSRSHPNNIRTVRYKRRDGSNSVNFNGDYSGNTCAVLIDFMDESRALY